MTRSDADLLVNQVADIAGCHPNSVRRYERRGLVRAHRDLNGYRRFTLQEALKLKAKLSWRSNETRIERGK